MRILGSTDVSGGAHNTPGPVSFMGGRNEEEAIVREAGAKTVGEQGIPVSVSASKRFIHLHAKFSAQRQQREDQRNVKKGSFWSHGRPGIRYCEDIVLQIG